MNHEGKAQRLVRDQKDSELRDPVFTVVAQTCCLNLHEHNALFYEHSFFFTVGLLND